MNKKNVHALLVIFAVLVGGIFIRQQQVHRGVVTEDYASLDFSFDRARVSKITLARAGKTEISAVKESGGWVLPDLWNAQADSKKVDDFLNGLVTVRGELRADDETLLADFGIEDTGALSIQLMDEKNVLLADLRIGAKRAGTASVFMRRANSNAVFLADMDLFRMLGIYGPEIQEPLQPRLWADLEPLQVRPADMSQLEVVRYEGTQAVPLIQLKKEAGENKPWTFSNAYSHFTLDAGKVDTYLRALATLRGSGVVDPAGSYGFEAPALQLKIQTPEKLWTLTVGKESADQRSRYLRVDGESTVYEIPKFTFDDLAADDSRFFTSGLAGLDKAVVEAVVLTKQGQEKRFAAADANTDAFQSILQTLRTLEYTGLLLSEGDKKKSHTPGLDVVTVEVKDADKIILDLGERIEGASGQGARYAAQLRADPVIFSVSEADYTRLFEALKPAAAPETNTSQPAPNKAE